MKHIVVEYVWEKIVAHRSCNILIIFQVHHENIGIIMIKIWNPREEPSIMKNEIYTCKSKTYWAGIKQVTYIPTMQSHTGISRMTQQKSHIKLSIEYARWFQSNAFWDRGLFKMLYWSGFSNESLSQANYRNHLRFVLLVLAIIVYKQAYSSIRQKFQSAGLDRKSVV